MINFGPKTLNDFFSKYNFTEAYNEHSDKATQYILQHSSEILDLVFNDPTELGAKAFLLITNCQIIAVDSFIENNMLFSKMTNYINENWPIDTVVVARMCSILTGYVRYKKDQSYNIIPYLINFLDYTDNEAVFSLYAVIYDQKAPINYLIKETASLDIFELINVSMKYLKSEEKITGVLRIVRLFVECPEIKPKFLTNDSINFFASYMDHKCDNVRAISWDIALALMDQNNFSFYQKYFELSISSLKDFFLKIDEMHILMIKMIIKFQSFGIFPTSFEPQFPEVLIRLIAQFFNHTTVINFISQYIINCLNNIDESYIIFQKILPPLVHFATLKEVSASRTMARSVLALYQKEFKNKSDFTHFVEGSQETKNFYTNVLPPYIQLLEGSYGGSFDKTVQQILFVD